MTRRLFFHFLSILIKSEGNVWFVAVAHGRREIALKHSKCAVAKRSFPAKHAGCQQGVTWKSVTHIRCLHIFPFPYREFQLGLVLILVSAKLSCIVWHCMVIYDREELSKQPNIWWRVPKLSQINFEWIQTGNNCASFESSLLVTASGLEHEILAMNLSVTARSLQVAQEECVALKTVSVPKKRCARA